jgi:hypothetical protein
MSKLLIALAACLLPATAPATIILVANMTNSQENPPVNPTTTTGVPRTSSGSATFTINDAMTAMSFTGTVSGIDVTGLQTVDVNDNLTAAHIHAGPLVTPTTNGGVVWGFIGTPLNNTSPNEFVLTPFSSGVGAAFSGTWNASEGNGTNLAAQLGNILGGRAYLNFHTTQFGSGELRGALLAVPEPGTLGLMLCGGMLFAATAMRRRGAGRQPFAA